MLILLVKNDGYIGKDSAGDLYARKRCDRFLDFSSDPPACGPGIPASLEHAVFLDKRRKYFDHPTVPRVQGGLYRWLSFQGACHHEQLVLQGHGGPRKQPFELRGIAVVEANLRRGVIDLDHQSLEELQAEDEVYGTPKRPLEAGKGLPISQSLEMRRAGSFARTILGRGAPANSIAIGLAPGDPATIVIWFRTRFEDESRQRFQQDIVGEP